MHLESRITWEKLALELELMATENPVTLIPVLIGLNALLTAEDCQEWCLRQINFMSYELQSRAGQLSEAERFDLLNHYLFVEKGFEILTPDRRELANEIMIKNILITRRGSALPLALLYLHFAGELEIPVCLLQIHHHSMIKWIRGGRACYLDLRRQGVLLSESTMLEILNRSRALDARPELLEGWKAQQILQSYVCELLKIYERENKPMDQHLCLNVLCKLDSTNMRLLGRRALLRRKLGLAREAMADLKRYFSFVEIKKASAELQRAHLELESLFEESPTAEDIVH